MTLAVPADVISRLKAVLGEGGWSQDPERLAPKLVEWRDRWSGTTPLLLLPRPEPLQVIAEVPDYPPRRFTWRRLDYKVVKAEGPERLSTEWWQAGEEGSKTRDYYRVEDENGRRFWLYREGLYEGSLPRWYLHGLFA